MVRIFIKKLIRTNGDVYPVTLSVLVESPELRSALGGGLGGGCDGDDLCIPEIIGFENIDPEQP